MHEIEKTCNRPKLYTNAMNIKFSLKIVSPSYRRKRNIRVYCQQEARADGIGFGE